MKIRDETGARSESFAAKRQVTEGALGLAVSIPLGAVASVGACHVDALTAKSRQGQRPDATSTFASNWVLAPVMVASVFLAGQTEAAALVPPPRSL